MSYFFFIDESGYNLQESPYAVLASVAIEDRELWNLIQAVKDAELKIFGMKFPKEIKATRFLNSKTFKLAAQLSSIPQNERTILAKQCLEDGQSARKENLTALGQAKLAYAKEVFGLCASYRCKVFASITSPSAFYPLISGFLRKDYTFLFERFFYFLEDKLNPNLTGIVVFDELEKTQSHLLVGEMDRYFKQTSKGRMMASQIIPEPFFVHSDLTTGIQLADFVAYIVSWAWNPNSKEPIRRENLKDFMRQVCYMRYRTVRSDEDGTEHQIWSFVPITDLRPRDMQ